jgi:hypothetical protein
LGQLADQVQKIIARAAGMRGSGGQSSFSFELAVTRANIGRERAAKDFVHQTGGRICSSPMDTFAK